MIRIEFESTNDCVKKVVATQIIDRAKRITHCNTMDDLSALMNVKDGKTLSYMKNGIMRLRRHHLLFLIDYLGLKDMDTLQKALNQVIDLPRSRPTKKPDTRFWKKREILLQFLTRNNYDHSDEERYQIEHEGCIPIRILTTVFGANNPDHVAFILEAQQRISDQKVNPPKLTPFPTCSTMPTQQDDMSHSSKSITYTLEEIISLLQCIGNIAPPPKHLARELIDHAIRLAKNEKDLTINITTLTETILIALPGHRITYDRFNNTIRLMTPAYDFLAQKRLPMSFVVVGTT